MCCYCPLLYCVLLSEYKFYQKSLLQSLQCHCLLFLLILNIPNNAVCATFDPVVIFLILVELQYGQWGVLLSSSTFLLLSCCFKLTLNWLILSWYSIGSFFLSSIMASRNWRSESETSHIKSKSFSVMSVSTNLLLQYGQTSVLSSFISWGCINPLWKLNPL